MLKIELKKNLLDTLVGQQLRKIFIKPNQEFTSENMLFDEIVFCFSESRMKVYPLPETDEIGVKISSSSLEFIHASYEESYFVEKDKYLNTFWLCTNGQGYFDLFILSFDYLHPSIMILSEGTVLKLCIPKFIEKYDSSNKK